MSLRRTLFNLTDQQRMKKHILACLILLFISGHVFSQKSADKSQQDSLITEQILDSALQMVYKNPVESKKLVETNMHRHNLSAYFKSKSLNYIGISYDVMGNNDSALVLYNSALKIANNHKLKAMQASVSNNIGLIHWKKGEYEKAIEKYDFSLRLFNKLDKTLGAANTLNNMGLIYQKMNDFDMSLKSFRSAAIKYDQIQDDRGKSAVFMNIGAIKDLKNEIDSAKYYFLEAIKLKKKVNDKYGLGLAYSDYSKNLYKRNICDSALIYSQNALRIFEEFKNEFHQSQILYAIGKDFICLNQLDSAEVYLRKAEILAQKKENIFTLRNISEQLIKVYRSQKKWEKAFEASQQMKVYNDSLFNAEKAEAIFEIKEKFESEQKNREIAEQKAELAIQNEALAKSDLENSRKNYWILLLSFSTLGIILLLIFGYRRSKQKQELLIREKEIKVQEEKLRISKELHDNIGARLSHIISSLDIQLYKNKEDSEISIINAFAKDTMNQLRETIWAVGDKTIYYSELKQRVEHYVNQTNSIATCQIDFVNDCTVDFELSATQTINVFRIVQESINNALKYSGASKINVRFTSRNNKIEIAISDNGRGFDIDHSAQLGNGLRNMKSRAEEINADLDIDSSKTDGTHVKLSFNIE